MTEQTRSKPDIERRDFLRRAAVIGWSTPMILTLMATSASASHGTGCIHLLNQCGTQNPVSGACEPFLLTNSTNECCQTPSAATCVPDEAGGCICVSL